MTFNINKCQILQIGSKIRKKDYAVCGVQTKGIQSVKDFGVTVSSNLKSSQQCNEAATKVNKMLVLIKRNFSFKNKDVLPFYNNYVRLYLEYAV